MNNKGAFADTILFLVGLGFAIYLTGCTFHTGIDWQGKTGVSDHRFTMQSEKKHGN